MFRTLCQSSKRRLCCVSIKFRKKILGVCALISKVDMRIVKEQEIPIRKLVVPLRLLAENYFLADSVKILNKDLK